MRKSQNKLIHDVSLKNVYACLYMCITRIICALAIYAFSHQIVNSEALVPLQQRRKNREI